MASAGQRVVRGVDKIVEEDHTLPDHFVWGERQGEEDR